MKNVNTVYKLWEEALPCDDDGDVSNADFFGRYLAVCLPPEAAPSASTINAAAYLPSLGSGVPFLMLYPAAPAAGTERTRRGLFPLQVSPPLTPQTHHQPGITQTTKQPGD